jgi:hypothetical protein
MMICARTSLTSWTQTASRPGSLKTLSGLKPYEYIYKIWILEADRFILNLLH